MAVDKIVCSILWQQNCSNVRTIFKLYDVQVPVEVSSEPGRHGRLNIIKK